MPLLLPPVSLGPRTWTWQRTCVFGVVNVTPDSFFDGGRYAETSQAVEHALALDAAGADVLDVGGESTRPGSAPVSAEQELDRVMPVIEGIRARTDTPVSIDTQKADVARHAVGGGASIINDISGLADEPMVSLVADSGAPVIVGHLRGRPATMQRDIAFDDVVAEVIDELRLTVRRAVFGGVKAEQIWVDPGIGFGKTAEQSLALLNATGRIRDELGYPVLVGPSRKSFIGSVTGQPPDERLMGTCGSVCAAIALGADAVRVHDVDELMPAIRVADAIRRSGREG